MENMKKNGGAMIYKNSDAGRAQFGFPNENNDCFVRAVATRFTMPYSRAHEICKEAGRKDGRGVKLPVIKAVCERLGVTIETFHARRTIGEYVRANAATGRHLVIVRGHAVTIVDGVCVDTVKTGPRRKVLGVIR